MDWYKKLNDKIPKRAILGVLMFLACMFSYVIRTNLSIIIVAMTTTNKKQQGPYCTALESNTTGSSNVTTVYIDERYTWTSKQQGIILASYFIGPLISSIPSGVLAEKIGGARVVAYATLIPALLNILMPFAAGLHWGLLLPLRFLMGLTGSAVYPALHAMIARWSPPNEKGMFVWTMQGGPFGTFVTFTLCSAIIHDYGWKAAYWVTSGLMIIFWAAWTWLAYDTPDVHPNITNEEKTLIKTSIGTSVSKQKVPLPLKDMFTSPPFLVLLWSHFANMWGIYFISINGPKYTLEILGLDMKSGGFLTGLPYIARLGAGALFAAIGDFVRRRKVLTVMWIRKVFMMFSHVIPGITLLIMTYVECDVVVAMTMLILTLAFNGAACQTNLQNHQDLAPNFAGSLYGVMNVVGSLPGFMISPIIGALVSKHNGVEEWRWMFWISSVIFFSATILFWIFGSANIQPWNDKIHPTQEANLETEEKSNERLTSENAAQNEDEENQRL